MFPRTGAKPDINQKHRAMWRLSACCRTKPLFKQVLCFFEEHVPVFLRNINVYRVNLTIGVTETIRGRSENLKGKDVRELYYGKKIWIFEDNGTFLCLSFLVYKDYVEGTLPTDIRRGTGQRMILGRVQRLALRKLFIGLEILL